jgi:hypothetical protein
MSFTSQNSAIRSRFHTNWGTDPPVKYDNMDFTPPANSAFVEISIIDGDQVPVSVGSSVLYRNLGFISVNIHVPLNTGTKAINQYEDTVAGIFRSQQFSGITCRNVTVNTVGEVNGRFVKNVSIEFFRDEAF